ncbi:MAG: cation:dicarboxylase symporter family transporter, partial [Acidobacteriia bacterium]|nr:cation:dicarboxylase symporter family transporter [Terriglobia bacterium]
IAPLIFSTLVIGIAGTGDFRKVGRIGLKAIIYFEIATTSRKSCMPTGSRFGIDPRPAGSGAASSFRARDTIARWVA